MSHEAVQVASGIRLAWDRAGAGPTVLLVHGIGASRKTWDRMVSPLPSGRR